MMKKPRGPADIPQRPLWNGTGHTVASRYRVWRLKQRRCWAPKWRQSGTEPDYRFTLANERTFLAWIRTTMAMLAGALVLEHLARNGPHPDVFLLTIAASITVMSIGVSITAYLHWRSNEVAMRHGGPLTPTRAIPWVMSSTVAASTLILGLNFFR